MEGETHGGSKSNTGSWLADNEDRDQWGEIQAESIRVWTRWRLLEPET